MVKHFKKVIVGIAVYGIGAAFFFGVVAFVVAKVAPGSVTAPTFGPYDDDVFVSAISCNWSGMQQKQAGCDNSGSGDDHICVALGLECSNGVLTKLGPGTISYNQGSSGVCPCGTRW